MQLLAQLSHRLLTQEYSQTYESMSGRVKELLGEMVKESKDFSFGREPFGKSYAEHCSNLRILLAHLEEDVKLLSKAKQAAVGERMSHDWLRAPEREYK
jgi:hypothetical protein